MLALMPSLLSIALSYCCLCHLRLQIGVDDVTCAWCRCCCSYWRLGRELESRRCCRRLKRERRWLQERRRSLGRGRHRCEPLLLLLLLLLNEQLLPLLVLLLESLVVLLQLLFFIVHFENRKHVAALVCRLHGLHAPCFWVDTRLWDVFRCLFVRTIVQRKQAMSVIIVADLQRIHIQKRNAYRHGREKALESFNLLHRWRSSAVDRYVSVKFMLA